MCYVYLSSVSFFSHLTVSHGLSREFLTHVPKYFGLKSKVESNRYGHARCTITGNPVCVCARVRARACVQVCVFSYRTETNARVKPLDEDAAVARSNINDIPELS